MKVSIILVIFGLVLVEASNAFDKQLNGDTLGAAATNLSSMMSSLDRVLSPQEEVIGKIGLFDGMKVAKTVCAELGSSVGYAFAVSFEIRLYTPGQLISDSTASRDLASQITNLINTLVGARNQYCGGNSTDLDKAKAAAAQAKYIASEIHSKIVSIRSK